MTSHRSIMEARRITSELGINNTELVENIAASLDKAFAEGVEMYRYVKLIESVAGLSNHPPAVKLDKRGGNG